VSYDRYCGVRADKRTNLAANAAGRIMHLRREVSAISNFFRHGQDLLRASFDTKLATLAIILVNNDTRHKTNPQKQFRKNYDTRALPVLFLIVNFFALYHFCIIYQDNYFAYFS
jgi:hypothetical protein